MRKLVLAAALIALAAPAGAQTATSPNVQIHNAAQGTVSAATRTFVANAVLADMFATAAGHLAVKKADAPAYLDFAQLMIVDHANTGDQLKTIAADLQGAPLPFGLDDAHQTKLDQLGALSGAAFERQYKADQIDGHRRAIAMFETYAGSGDNAALKNWAAGMLPKLKEHLAHAEALPNPVSAPTTASGMNSK